MVDTHRSGGRQWRVLVVGCGSIGRRHVANLLRLGQQQVLLMDHAATALERASREFGLSGVGTLEEGLAWSPETVIVATPTADHVQTALAAARCGCHLFIEKPLADTLEGTDALIRLAQERQLITLIGCNMRFHPGPRLVRQALNDGTLGTPLGARLEVGSFLPSWRPGTDYHTSYSAQKDQGGGCLLDGIHELDIACWLFGFPQELFAMTREGNSLRIETEELAEVVLRYPSDLVVSVHVDYVQRWRQRRCEVIAQRGTVVWESRTGQVQVMGTDERAPRPLDYPTDYESNQMYVEELRHFLRCLDGREQPCADISWAARVTRVVLAAKASAQTREPVALEWEPSVSVAR